MELNHVAVFVDDLDATVLGVALGGWGAPAVTISRQPVTVAGRPAEHSGRTRRIRTASRPQFGVSVEDVAPGAPIQPVPGNAWHHVAIWCNDIPASVRSLEEQGYRRDVVGRDANGELATFAYMISPRGPRLELADARMRQGMLEYFAKATAAAGPAAQGVLSAPLAPCEVAVVVETAPELEALQQCWRTALAADWGASTDTTVIVQTPDGERELQTRTVSTSGDPRLTIVAPAPGSRSLLAPVASNGWHHVAFRSSDLASDVASLERSGFEMEFCDGSDRARPRSFAMMASPEGTRIKLIKA